MTAWTPRDEYFMSRALQLARTAEALGEVPVGCVVVRGDSIVGEAYNGPIGANDPTAHAEILALRLAGHAVGNYRLVDCDLYVTLEPCPMCAGAMVHARIRRLLFGALDPKTGAAGSVLNGVRDERLNHQVQVLSGLMADEAGTLLTEFFQRRRQARKAERKSAGPDQ